MPFVRRQKDIYLHFICFHCFAYFLLFIKNSHFIVLLRKNSFYAHIIFYCFAHKLFIHTLMPQNRFIGYVLLLQTSILKATVFILSEFPSRILFLLIHVMRSFENIALISNSKNQQKLFHFIFPVLCICCSLKVKV